MTRKFLDLNLTVVGNRLSAFFDGLYDHDRTYIVPKAVAAEVNIVMRRGNPVDANQMIRWMEENACRV